MKIFILTEGGKDIGFGHIARCSSLYQAFEERGITSKLIVNGDESVKYLLKGKDHILIRWVREKSELIKLIKNTDFVVIDSYLAQKPLYDKISYITDGRIAIIDDYNRLSYPKGTVINPSIYGDKIHYLKKSKTTYLIGRNYVMLRKEFRRVPKKLIRKNISDILITFGGIVSADFIIRLVAFLLKKFPNLTYHIVMPVREFDISNLIHNYNIKLYSKLSDLDIRNLMQKCDICISGGGQTLYELARCGVPTIGICLAENQIRNLKGLQKEGFLKYVGWYTDPMILSRISKTVEFFIPQRMRECKSMMGANIVDGKGTARVVDNILKKHADERHTRIILRKANIKDSRDLLIWRNHSSVRKWCLNTNVIKYAKHREWVKRRLKDKKAQIYIAENNENKKIGQIRFETESRKSAYVNVNLNPQFIGKGLGGKVIETATKTFKSKHPAIEEIIAEIIKGNTASEKAFRKAGYTFFNNGSKNGKKILIYKAQHK